MKIASHKQMIKVLKQNGFYIERTGKHNKWTNGRNSVFVPNNHNNFSRVLAERLLKEIELI
jgi:predicted RNA binding protein YcfA (HicA-like mRNA interferase family)